MASTCPKCRAVVEEDYICCADVRYTWKCAGCGKRSTGFVVPFGVCPLCGGRLSVVERYELPDASRIRPIREALQFEVNAYAFYTMAAAHARSSALRTAFEGMAQFAAGNLTLLAEKYHAHLTDEERAGFTSKQTQDFLFRKLGALQVDNHLEALYRRALEMERRAKAFFLERMAGLPEGTEREIYRELAAEEEEHLAILETEWENVRQAPAPAPGCGPGIQVGP